MKRNHFFHVFIVSLCLLTIPAYCCTVPDNGSGTANLPPDGCTYASYTDTYHIIDGLPPGTTIEIEGVIRNFINVVRTGGGTLGGEIQQFEATFDAPLYGTGSLAGYNRTLSIPMVCEVHTGPRNPGDPVQTFDSDFIYLNCEFGGDPDFDYFRLRLDPSLSPPGPGQTSLTELPSGDFAVDSFFDITYEIEFTGAPGSPLDGYAGTTTGTIHVKTDAYSADWGRLQWPLTIEETSGTGVTVYGHVYAPGITTRTSGSDPSVYLEAGVGYGTVGTDPSTDASWVWTSATINPAWNDASEPGNDEYMGTLTTPGSPGDYDYAYRFSADTGTTWLYCDKNAGYGSDGSEDGYASSNAGKMTVLAYCCIVPDNGTGTADLPPVGCTYAGYDDTYHIIDGLPPGTTMEIDGVIKDFLNIFRFAGGSLGGQVQQFDATFDAPLYGTGSLAGYNRSLSIPITCEVHTGPRNPGDPVQTFDADWFRLQGELLGDPDFNILRFRAGTDLGLPSSGQTTLTELPSGDFAVDSFFDITYEIEFTGAPGSQLDGYTGTTTGTIRIRTCETSYFLPVPAGIDYWLTYSAEFDFGAPPFGPLPADYFGPGSDPFDGIIAMKGKPVNPSTNLADTVIERMEDAETFDPPAPIDIELVELNLVSTEPVRVTFSGGMTESFFDVTLTPDPYFPSMGQMTLSKTSQNEGIFDFTIGANLAFNFVSTIPGTDLLYYIGPVTVDGDGSYPWQNTDPLLRVRPSCEQTGFFPSGGGTFVLEYGSSASVQAISEKPIPGDIDLDNDVDLEDLADFAQWWLTGM